MPKVKIQKVKNVERFLFKVDEKRDRRDSMKEVIHRAIHPPEPEGPVCKEKGCKLQANSDDGYCNICYQFKNTEWR